jgi:GntR family transcriptional regulator
VLPFVLEFQPGAPVYEQVIYAVRRAVLRGQLAPGQAFPSVRALSQELRINPNTAHKVVAALTVEGVLEVRPGIGTVIADGRKASPEDRAALLRGTLERLVVDAKRLGLTEAQIAESLHKHWKSLS